MNKLQIFEFPIENELYKAKKNISYINRIFNSNDLNKLSFVKSIKKNENYSRNGKCSNKSILDTMDLDNKMRMEYDHKSCDPILFEYDLYDSVVTSNEFRSNLNLDNYEFDNNRYSILLDNITNTLHLKKIPLVEYLVEALVLPELNYISCFSKESIKCDMDGFVTTNKNLKLNSLTFDLFYDTLEMVTKIWSPKVIDPIFLKKKEEFDSLIDRIGKDLTIKDVRSFPRIVYIEKHFHKGAFCFFGDIHGSLHTLVRSLLRLVSLKYINKDFTLKKDFHIYFLGDLIDRNIYGIDILFILMQLFLLNPNQIHMIRGNHEEIQTNKKYFFYNEFLKLTSDVKKAHSLYFEYCKTWLYLPSAIFLNHSSYIQLCHGGFYKDAKFIKKYLESDNIIQVITNENNMMDIQWSDYNCGFVGDDALTDAESNKQYGKQTTNRGLVFKVNDSLSYMKYTGIKAVIRGHQDFADNTKLIVINPEKCKNTNKQDRNILPIEYVETKELLKPTSFNSFEMTLPELNELDIFSKKYTFPPIITLSTGTTSRFVDCDGFAILGYLKQKGGNNLYNTYNAYKAKYINLKKSINQ